MASLRLLMHSISTVNMDTLTSFSNCFILITFFCLVDLSGQKLYGIWQGREKDSFEFLILEEMF